MAAGKSTVADLLARRYPRAVHVRGDAWRKMIVTGRDPITPGLGPEAILQLYLRRHLAAVSANEYWRAGFTVVLQDIYVGGFLPAVIEEMRTSPLHVVVLSARPEVVADREAARRKTGYGDWDPGELCATFANETPRLGLWLDTSDMTPEQTVDAILARKDEARVK